MAARALSLVAAVLALLVVGSHALNSWKAGTSFHHTYLSGISFTSPAQGWLAGFDGFHNGARIFNTSNAGASWGNHTFTRHDSLSFTCIAMDPSGRGTVAGNGVLTTSGLAYTTDFGATWSDSEILHLEGRFRDCGLVPGTNGSSVWTVGQWFKIQDLHGEGVALSEDGGHRFRYFDWEIGVPSRFGSFLTKNFGYVSGGRYPQVLFENRDRTVRVSSEDKNIMRLSGLLAYYKGEMMHATQVRDHTYLGAIARTDDRGRRFNLMYNSTLNNLNVCFNGISFIDSFHGWVVAEGYNLTTGKHGGWIFSTANGGITWKQLLYVEHVSFLRIRMLNANEGWAIGGRVPSPFLVSGEFYHTTDGGKTWDSETHRDVFPLNLDLIDSKNGFATGLTLRGDTQVFQYKTR